MCHQQIMIVMKIPHPKHIAVISNFLVELEYCIHIRNSKFHIQILNLLFKNDKTDSLL